MRVLNQLEINNVAGGAIPWLADIGFGISVVAAVLGFVSGIPTFVVMGASIAGIEIFGKMREDNQSSVD